ncbi:MAG: hypothetical protein H2069_04410 [Legionella sp.]|nr:hypothetical protein [Legionella sp.]
MLVLAEQIAKKCRLESKYRGLQRVQRLSTIVRDNLKKQPVQSDKAFLSTLCDDVQCMGSKKCWPALTDQHACL